MANIVRLGGGGGSTPTLITKSITQNGTYNASSDNADGYSEVNVNVSGGGELHLLYSLEQTQGGQWFNTNIDTTQYDKLLFINSVNGDDGYMREIAISDIIVVNSGTANDYTEVFSEGAIGKMFICHIYNNELWVGYNASGSSGKVVSVYNEISGGGSPQTQFRYLKWHITDNGVNNNVLQIAEVEFRNENDVAFTMPTGFTATSSMPPFVPEDDVYVLFDGTDRKLVILPWVSGTSVEDITIDLGVGNYLDISEYPYFCWKAGNDDNRYVGRAPRVWQLYGANRSDFSDAVVLDNTTVPVNTQNAIWAYKSRMILNVINGGGSGIGEHIDLSSFAHYFRRNTATPTITQVSTTEVALTYQDQNNSGYELSSYSIPLDKGIYVVDIYATTSAVGSQRNYYTWGIYSTENSGWAQLNGNEPMDNQSVNTYVPFIADTNEHFYEVPLKLSADGTGYICFATAGDGGVNATVTVRSLKIRKVSIDE